MTGTRPVDLAPSEGSSPGSGDDDVSCPPLNGRSVPSRSAERPWGYRVVELIGRGLVGVGAVVLSFLAFQIWGTAVQHQRAQDDLASEFARSLAEHRSQLTASGGVAGAEGGPSAGRSVPDPDPDTDIDPGPDPATGIDPDTDIVTVPARPRPDAGTAVARIEASTIGLDKTVVEGVGRPQLRAGPGLYPISPLPGHRGNVAIAGHRTTHGSPFADLDDLQPGDPIVLETVDGRFTYRVEGQVTADGGVLGHRIVEPDAVDVIADLGDSRLTLTSCHPRYSDRQRLVVTAVLEGPGVAFPATERSASTVIPDRLGQTADPRLGDGRTGDAATGEQSPATVAVPTNTGLDEPLGWQMDRWPEAAWWAAVLLVTVIPAIVLHRRRRRLLALISGVVLSSYPLVALFSVVDAMAPAW